MPVKINIRKIIQNSNQANSELATRFNTSEQTVSKWKNKDFSSDKSFKLHKISYSLSEIE
jgi:DNA-binding transcriptional regulator YiaG